MSWFCKVRDTHCGFCLFVLVQSERAARKATILQMATMYTVLGGTLLNIGVTFSNQGGQLIANGSFIGAGMEAVYTRAYRYICKVYFRSMPRVNKLDKQFFWCRDIHGIGTEVYAKGK